MPATVPTRMTAQPQRWTAGHYDSPHGMIAGRRLNDRRGEDHRHAQDRTDSPQDGIASPRGRPHLHTDSGMAITHAGDSAWLIGGSYVPVPGRSIPLARHRPIMLAPSVVEGHGKATSEPLSGTPVSSRPLHSRLPTGPPPCLNGTDFRAEPNGAAGLSSTPTRGARL